MADILTPAFWQEQADDAYKGTARVLYEIFGAGGAVGSRLLPKHLRVLLDWDVFNQAAVDYLDTYQLATVPGIIGTNMQRKSIDIIQKWIKGGEPLDALTQRLSPLFGKQRAQRIAVTEVTRTYASGNLAAWKSTGMVTGKRWRSANDELVCPVCGPLDGKIVDVDGNFKLEDVPADWGDPSQFVYFQPPAHVNCRCFLFPIVSETAVRQNVRGILEQ